MSKSNDDVVIELKDVWKIYKSGEVETVALRGINLDIKKGEFISIMGPSGSGKSTLMNQIGALDTPTKGDVYLKGHNIKHLSENSLAQIRGKYIGFVFQRYNLIPTLNAIENVMLPMIFQGVEFDRRLDVATSLLKKVGLEKRINNRPTEMSGGEQQRVAIARALANNPDVILADEPTGNLDSKSGGIIMEMLKELNEKEGKTIVLVTHDKKVASFGHKIVTIKDGRISGIYNSVKEVVL